MIWAIASLLVVWVIISIQMVWLESMKQLSALPLISFNRRKTWQRQCIETYMAHGKVVNTVARENLFLFVFLV